MNLLIGRPPRGIVANVDLMPGMERRCICQMIVQRLSGPNARDCTVLLGVSTASLWAHSWARGATCTARRFA